MNISNWGYLLSMNARLMKGNCALYIMKPILLQEWRYEA